MGEPMAEAAVAEPEDEELDGDGGGGNARVEEQVRVDAPAAVDGVAPEAELRAHHVGVLGCPVEFLPVVFRFELDVDVGVKVFEIVVAHQGGED